MFMLHRRTKTNVRLLDASASARYLFDKTRWRLRCCTPSSLAAIKGPRTAGMGRTQTENVCKNLGSRSSLSKQLLSEDTMANPFWSRADEDRDREGGGGQHDERRRSGAPSPSGHRASAHRRRRRQRHHGLRRRPYPRWVRARSRPPLPFFPCRSSHCCLPAPMFDSKSTNRI